MSGALALSDIERMAEAYAAACEDLRRDLDVLEGAIRQAKRAMVPNLLRRAAVAAGAKATLRKAVEENPSLFSKPRTRVAHGVQVGYRKAKGKLAIEDETLTLKLIRKHFADQADVLIETTEKPVKSALNQLPAADLKRLAVTVLEAGDEVVVKVLEGEVEKLVDAFLHEADALGPGG
ncbi:MAG: hypothetical protein ACOYXN_00535 [Acidobacteriota bacterium]